MPLTEKLYVSGVTFTDPKADRPAPSGRDLTVEANTTVGIVGATGAGKTTVVDLILGLLEPPAGHVAVDGTPLTRETLRACQRTLGYVPGTAAWWTTASRPTSPSACPRIRSTWPRWSARPGSPSCTITS